MATLQSVGHDHRQHQLPTRSLHNCPPLSSSYTHPLTATLPIQPESSSLVSHSRRMHKDGRQVVFASRRHMSSQGRSIPFQLGEQSQTASPEVWLYWEVPWLLTETHPTSGRVIGVRRSPGDEHAEFGSKHVILSCAALVQEIQMNTSAERPRSRRPNHCGNLHGV